MLRLRGRHGSTSFILSVSKSAATRLQSQTRSSAQGNCSAKYLEAWVLCMGAQASIVPEPSAG